MKINTKLVSVIIITNNRLNYLLITLRNLKKQDYKNLEIFVVDNGSKAKISLDDINEFKDIQLVNLDKNYGIEAFNWVIGRVKGDYILILDDDSYPENGTIAKAIDYLGKDKSCGVVALNIYNSKFDFFETKDLQQGYVHLFVGCGVIFKSEVISKVGFYDKMFFVYVNEIDLSIRIINNGYKIYYLKDALVVHMSAGSILSSANSSPFRSKFRFYHVTCGYFIFLLKHFSIKWVLIYSLKWNLNRIIVAVKFNYYLDYIKSIFRFLYLLPRIIKGRQVVKKEVQELYQNGNFPLIDRDFFPNFDKKQLFLYRFFTS